MDYVRYIDKTREYYLAEGYDAPYRWAHFDDVPFAPLDKPLSECCVALVSTSDVAITATEEDGDEDPTHNFLTGSTYSIPTDIPVERLYSRQEHYDKYATHLDDVNTYFPVSRLYEFAATGRIGRIAPRAHGVYTQYSRRRTLENDGPEVLKRCREDGVDAVLATPV